MKNTGENNDNAAKQRVMSISQIRALGREDLEYP
jgi:hypothetical protein